MTKRGAFNPLFLLILLMIILGGVYGGILIYQSRETDKEIETVENEKTIINMDTDLAKSLQIKTDNSSVIYQKDSIKWLCKGEIDRPLDQDTISQMISVFKSMTASRTVTKKAEDLAEYGLEDPKLSGYLTLSDGTNAGIMIGMESPSDSGTYYAKVDGKDAIYLVSSSVYTTLNQSLNEITKISSTPTLSDDNVTSIEVMKKGLTTFEIQYHDDLWTLDQPYGEAVAADSNSISSFISSCSEIAYSENIDYTGKELKEYGLEAPAAKISISYTDEGKKTFSLIIGDQADDGSYYVKGSNNKSIYKLSETTVESMIEVDAADYLDKTVMSLEADDIKSVKIAVDENTNLIKNSEEITNIVEWITGLEIGKVTTSGIGKKLMTITLKSETSQTIKFYSYNENYAALESGNGVYMLVDLREVNRMISELTK